MQGIIILLCEVKQQRKAPDYTVINHDDDMHTHTHTHTTFQNVDRNHKIQAMNGKQYFLIDVIAHILYYLKEKTLKEFRDSRIYNSPLKVPDIDWVITVPAIWKARGKRMMREAGYMVKYPHSHYTNNYSFDTDKLCSK